MTNAVSACQTLYFGELDVPEDSIFMFPEGVPGFEASTLFTLIQNPAHNPLVFLQSLADPRLCFIAVPAASLCPTFAIGLSDEEREILGLDTSQPVRPGTDVVCLALISAADGQPPTANLACPIVLSVSSRTGLQALHGDSRFSHRHPLEAGQEASCS